jgi:hypothetical protein
VKPEAKVENRLRNRVKALGGVAVKFAAPGYRSWPDRLVLMPGGEAYFVELKVPGKKPTPQQLLRHEMLLNLGFPVTVLDSTNNVDTWIDATPCESKSVRADDNPAAD